MAPQQAPARVFDRWVPTEHPLAPHVDHVWWSRGSIRPPERLRVLPDGRVEVVWSPAWFGVGGHVTRPLLLGDTAPLELCGVQFRLGHAAAVLGVRAGDIVGAPVQLHDVWGRDATLLHEQLRETVDPRERARRLLDALSRRAGEVTADVTFDAAVRGLCRPNARISEVSGDVGLSERQLRRRFERDVGFGPKLLQRLERFQRFVAIATAGRELGRAAAEAGYVDQSHLTRETRDFSGVTPGELLGDRLVTGRRRD